MFGAIAGGIASALADGAMSQLFGGGQKAASGAIQDDVLATDINTVGMGDAGIKSAIQVYNVPNPDETILFFFFQAEDGIRDLTVTGVQTCALPISAARAWPPRRAARRRLAPGPAGQVVAAADRAASRDRDRRQRPYVRLAARARAHAAQAPNRVAMARLHGHPPRRLVSDRLPVSRRRPPGGAARPRGGRTPGPGRARTGRRAGARAVARPGAGPVRQAPQARRSDAARVGALPRGPLRASRQAD